MINVTVSKMSLSARVVRRCRHAAAIFVTPPPPVMTDRRTAAPLPTVCMQHAGAGTAYCRCIHNMRFVFY